MPSTTSSRSNASAFPHFYRAFYVYKYATGLSAAIALAERVTSGGRRELDDYLGFLKGRLLEVPARLAARGRRRHGTASAVDAALGYFEKLVGELDELL